MNISKLLKKLQIEHESRGKGDFQSMGLLKSDTDLPLCSYLQDEKYIKDIGGNISVLLVTETLAQKASLDSKLLCIVKNPRDTFFRLHNVLSKVPLYIRESYPTKIDSDSWISPLAKVAEKNVTIGKGVVIEDFVTVKENTHIGDGTILRSGVIVGGEGFEFKMIENRRVGIVHTGGVILEDEVELQQSVTVDKAIYPWDNTVIGAESKIDNLTYVAHGAKVAKQVLVGANVNILGRAKIGNRVWIGPGASVRNGMEVGEEAYVSMGSIVTQNVERKEQVTGNFAVNHEVFLARLNEFSKS